MRPRQPLIAPAFRLTRPISRDANQRGIKVPIDIERLATRIYVETVSPCIMERATQGSNLDKLFKAAAANSIAAAEEFARAYDGQKALSAAPVV